MVGSLHDHTEGIKSVKFSFDSQKVITASNDKTVRMFDVATELLAPIENTFDSYFEGNKCPINSVSFSPDGSTLVSTAGKLISLWNVHSRKLLANLDGHNDEVLSAAYNTSNSKICSCAKDGTVIVWDSITYEVIATRTESSVMSASFTLDGYKIVLRTSDYRVSFWDYFAGNIIHEYCNPLQVYRHDPYQVNLVTFCPEGLMKTISIVNSTVSINGIDVKDDSRQEVQLWDVVSKELISTLDPHPPLPTTPPACISDDDGHEFPDEEDADSSDGVVGVLSRSFSFSPDGLSVAVGYTDGAIVVSHSRNGKTVMTLSGHRASVSTLCFNIEGLRLVSGSEDCSIKIWDIHAGMLVTTLYGHRDTVRHVTYSPCGLKVASSSSDKTLILWDAVSLKERVEEENTIEDGICYNVDSAVESSFVSQMTAIIGNVEKTVDPDDEFLNAEELRIKSYQFQYVDGW
jgi:WD40 repeat protein